MPCLLRRGQGGGRLQSRNSKCVWDTSPLFRIIQRNRGRLRRNPRTAQARAKLELELEL